MSRPGPDDLPCGPARSGRATGSFGRRPTSASDDPAPDDPFRGLYVNDETVDRLLGDVEPWPDPDAESHARVEREADQVEADGQVSRLRQLARDAKLSDLDVELLVIALIPDLDSRFERLLRLPERRRDPATCQRRPGPGAGRCIPDVRGRPGAGLPRRAHSSTTAWSSSTTSSGRSSPDRCGCRTGLPATCWATASPRRRCDVCSRRSTDIRVRWPTGSPWGWARGCTLTHITRARGRHGRRNGRRGTVRRRTAGGRRGPVPAGPRPRPRRPRSRCRPRGAVAGRRAGGGTDRGPRGRVRRGGSPADPVGRPGPVHRRGDLGPPVERNRTADRGGPCTRCPRAGLRC